MVDKIKKSKQAKPKLELASDPSQVPFEVEEIVKVDGKDTKVRKIRAIAKLGDETAEVDYFNGAVHPHNPKDKHDVEFVKTHGTELTALMNPWASPGHMGYVQKQLTIREDENRATEGKLSNWQNFGIGVAVIGLPVAAGLGYFAHAPEKQSDGGQSYEDGQQDILWKVPGYVKENKTAWEAQNHIGLEGKILNTPKWNSSVVNETAVKMFGTHDLKALSTDQLTTLFGQLYFNAGAFSTPAVENATTLIKTLINDTYKVPMQQMNNISFVAAVKLVGELEAHKAVTAKVAEIMKLQDAFNSSWYQQGKKEILDNITSWDQIYKAGIAAGEQNILNQTPIWGAQNLSQGKILGQQFGQQISLDEVLGTVGKLLNQTEIDGANKNITALIELYQLKASADAEKKGFDKGYDKGFGEGYDSGLQDLYMTKWMEGVTTDALANMTPVERNSTLETFMNMVDMFPEICKPRGWDYVQIDKNTNETVLSDFYNDGNISKPIRDDVRYAINGDDYMIFVNTTKNDSWEQRYSGITNNINTDGKPIADQDFTRVETDIGGKK